MNCKEGDLAVVVHSDNQGAIVRVLRRSANEDLYSSVTGWKCRIWECEALSRIKMWNAAFFTQDQDAQPGAVVPFADEMLRPIRDPGDDAQDETISWLPVPMPEIIPAMLDREVEHG